MKKIHHFVFSLGVVFLLFPLATFAGDTPPGGLTVKIDNPLKIGTLEDLLIAILNIIMVLMVPVIVFFIIFAGFKYVTARGNANSVQEATRALTYAVIGAVIVLGAVAISQIIKSTVDGFRTNPADPTATLPGLHLALTQTNLSV